MMWSTIANLKENLSKIAQDVHDDDDDDQLEIYSPGNGHVSDRRLSNTFAHSNGLDSPYNSEMEQFKAEIKRLQESEAEIKTLSINYAALLKEKEDRIIRLNEENDSLKQNLEATNATIRASRNGSFKSSAGNALKGADDQSPIRQPKSGSQVKNRFTGNQMVNGVVAKQDGISNGVKHSGQTNMDSEQLNMMGKEKELADLVEEKNRSLESAQATHELQMKQLKMELEKERDKSANVLEKLQEEHQRNGSLMEELKSLRLDKERTFSEMSKLRSELNEKLSEIRQLQMELNRREGEGADGVVEKLKRVITVLENENANLKMEKHEHSSLKLSGNPSTSMTSESSNKDLSSFDEKLDSGSFPGKEELEQSLQKLEKDLKDACREKDKALQELARLKQHLLEELEQSLQKLEKDLKDACREKDKALQELARLKQHLLEKEYEESEKMDEDSKIIEELRGSNEIQRAQILHLEKALKQAIASQEDVRMANTNELQKSKELIDALNKKVTNLMGSIDAKNVELLNLQTALGQYYAEIEARERVERDLSLAREESTKLSELLKDADHKLEISKKEKEDILAKLSETEKLLVEGKTRVNKLEEDNAKLRRAVEQSMTRLNRMSLDSDYLVDRRIVIKLLVTYFQRSHSKEVLDLMVRMLGFSDEDKQRIGGAQQGSGKGVVRGVLGLPGRFVGGILGGSSPDAHANAAPESESFADLWVDFLLKETEEREKREAIEGGSGSNEDTKGGTVAIPSLPLGFQRANLSTNQGPNPSRREMHSDSEFSTVPLTSSESNSRISKLLPRY